MICVIKLRLDQRLFYRLPQIVIEIGQVNDIARNAQPHRHVQRVARRRNQRLEPGALRAEGERLAQETGIAIQVVFRGLDACENGRRHLLRSVLHHVLCNRLE